MLSWTQAWACKCSDDGADGTFWNNVHPSYIAANMTRSTQDAFEIHIDLNKFLDKLPKCKYHALQMGHPMPQSASMHPTNAKNLILCTWSSWPSKAQAQR